MVTSLKCTPIPATSPADPFKFEYARVFPHHDFPLGASICRRQAPNEYHYHENFSEMVIILKGRGRHFCAGMTYDIVAGDVFVIHGKTVHSYAQCDDLEICNILFNWEELKLPWFDLSNSAAFQVLFHIDPRNQQQDRFDRRFRLSGDDLSTLSQLATELHWLLQSEVPGSRFAAVGKFIEVISYVLQSYGKNSAQEEDSSTVPHRLGILAGLLGQPGGEHLSIGGMCKITGMSRTTLFRNFRRFYYESPYAYQTTQRLNRAAELLLREPELPIGELALRVDFGDGSYFTRLFREYYGMTPRRYREWKLSPVRHAVSSGAGSLPQEGSVAPKS